MFWPGLFLQRNTALAWRSTLFLLSIISPYCRPTVLDDSRKYFGGGAWCCNQRPLESDDNGGYETIPVSRFSELSAFHSFSSLLKLGIMQLFPASFPSQPWPHLRPCAAHLMSNNQTQSATNCSGATIVSIIFSVFLLLPLSEPSSFPSIQLNFSVTPDR